ncbi:MAG TPA: glycosyltransferase [Candidatus Saccharimonadales bacterium]|nr:glycosyltransferase [Candidatus Saccharimonadales bacterium]
MLKTLLIYLPLSIIGLWRWTFWLIRVAGARMYRPRYTRWPHGKAKLSVSVVTPVYNEDEKLFKMAVDSWINNGVNEIIAVIDKANKKLITDFHRRYGKVPQVKTKLIVTPKKGKRAALCDGIMHAKGDIIVLADSDTIWDKDVVRNTLPHFLDEGIGGATVTQRISNPHTLSNVLFDILLWTRYKEEVPFMLGLGRVFNTLSGRTAFYRREALLNDEYDNLHDLRHEKFFRTRGVSGDDKRLTHLILEQGWHISFVNNATVYTAGLNNMKSFLKQRLRWVRNSWRADLRALKRGWVMQHPVLAIHMIDRFIQPFFMLLGPVAFVTAIIIQQWPVAIILGLWWLISRLIRLFGYFRLYPRRLVYLPAYIIYSYINALTKIYALATLLEQGWVTRWHKSRMKKHILRKVTTPMVGMAALVLLLTGLLNFVKQVNVESGASLDIPPAVNAAEFSFDEQELVFIGIPTQPELPNGAVLPTEVKTYVIRPGDTINSLSAKFGMSIPDIKRLNGISDPDKISAGQTILYYKNAGVSE